MTRRCIRCGLEKPVEDFPLRRLDGTARHSYCRACKVLYQLEWYQRNRTPHMANVQVAKRKQRVENKAIIAAAKSAPCADCGKTFPSYVMDFDHVRGTKAFTIASRGDVTAATLKGEIAKCDLVCANCHRIRTFC